MLTFSPFAPGSPTKPADPGEPCRPCNPCSSSTLSSLRCSGTSGFITIRRSQCHLLGVQEHHRRPFLPSSQIQALPAWEHGDTEHQTYRSLHRMLNNRSGRLTLGPGIPCKPWKTLCPVSTKVTTANKKTWTEQFLPWFDWRCLYSPWIQGTRELLVGQEGQVGLAGESSEPENNKTWANYRYIWHSLCQMYRWCTGYRAELTII